MNPKEPDRMEKLLKTALSREEAPPAFAVRVMAKINQQRSDRQITLAPWYALFSRPLIRWAAFAAVSASLVAGAIHYREVRHERVQGEAAKQQLMLALHIAGRKLQLAKTKVNQIHTRPESKPEPNQSRSKS